MNARKTAIRPRDRGAPTIFDERPEVMHREITEAVKGTSLRSVTAFANVIVGATNRAKSVYVCGNGGSAGLACHFATELTHIVQEGSAQPVRAHSLSSNNLLLTALANDYGFERLFQAQLRSLVVPGDVVLGISSSGRSKNVLRALNFARRKGAIILGLTGSDKMPFQAVCHQYFAVRSDRAYAIETAHLCFIHLLSSRIRDRLSGGRASRS